MRSGGGGPNLRVRLLAVVLVLLLGGPLTVVVGRVLLTLFRHLG